jgi:hypothetical protein
MKNATEMTDAEQQKTYANKCQAASFLHELQENLQRVHPNEGKEVTAILHQMFKDEPQRQDGCKQSQK